MIRVVYPSGSGSRYVVSAEDVDTELSFYYGLASVQATPLSPEQAAAVTPVMARLATAAALIEAEPAPYLRTATDRAVVAKYMVDTDTAMMDLEIMLDSFGFSPFEPSADMEVQTLP